MKKFFEISIETSQEVFDVQNVVVCYPVFYHLVD